MPEYTVTSFAAKLDAVMIGGNTVVSVTIGGESSRRMGARLLDSIHQVPF